MEEENQCVYAIQIAVHTLKERCKSFQQQIALLEEENVQLRVKCTNNDKSDNVTNVGRLKKEIAELSEQKNQLSSKLQIVTGENQKLWYKLGRISKDNVNMGSQLSKINTTLSKSLIRSNTFVQNVNKNTASDLDDNNKLSMELENISLKLLDSFSKDKLDIESLTSEIKKEYENCFINEDFAIYYDADSETIENHEIMDNMFEEMKELKEQLVQQKNLINLNMENLNKFKKLPDKIEKSTSTENLIQDFDMDNTLSDLERFCPVCSKSFSSDVSFEQFQQHVEEHFLQSVDLYA